MKKRYVNLWSILFLIALASCSKNDGNEIEEPTQSNLKQITAFIFKSDNNTALNVDIRASINETDKIVSATMPYGTDINVLTPDITVSDKAEANNSSPNDFSGIVKITITAEDGSTVTYDIVVTVESNNANNILSLTFSITDNPIPVTIVGEIDEENKAITFETPLSTDISSFLPNILTSEGSHFSPEGRQDFNEPVVYTITAENGSEKNYEVIWEISQRDILLTLYHENPENTLNWDLENPDITTWEGVTTDAEGNVIELSLGNKFINHIPKAIGRLTLLTTLNLSSNFISEIPAEIGKLANLTQFSMYGNGLTSLPSAIGQLIQLQTLGVSANALRSLPPEIGQLTNLVDLFIGGNELDTLPKEFSLLNITSLELLENNFATVPSFVFRMPNLETFSISQNPLKSLPSTIGEAKKLKFLSIRDSFFNEVPDEIGGLESLISLNLSNGKLITIPNTIGQLTNLENLSLRNNLITQLPQEIGQLIQLKEFSCSGNQLASLPEELGLLINLETLSLTSNPSLATIPQAVCDLESTGTNIFLDPATVCQ